jgi:polar amino acid transport system substrate-binding protein
MAVGFRDAFIQEFRRRAKRTGATLLIFNIFLASGCIFGPVRAQGELFLPAFSDPHRRAEAPGPEGKKPLRFLTSDDYPPFQFVDPQGALAGFNIDVARAICEQLQASCTIQPRRWDNLLDALEAKEGDALIASMKPAVAKGRAIFTEPYYFTPARFVVAVGSEPLDPRPEGMAAKKIGVEAGGAHEAFLRKFFPRAVVVAFQSRAQMMQALTEKQVDAGFGDAISLSLWMNDSPGFVFSGGPWLEPAYFGEGIGIGVAPDDQENRRRLNWALQKLDESGKLTEFYLKYFPIAIY